MGIKLPHTQHDWHDKRRAVDAVMDEIGGVVIRVGDETIGEMWSLCDGNDLPCEIDPRLGENIERHIHQALRHDRFHVSANADPKGERSKPPQEQDPDMLLRVVEETDAGIVVRGAVGLCPRFHRPGERAWHKAHLPHRVRWPRSGGRLSTEQAIRRSRHADRLR